MDDTTKKHGEDVVKDLKGLSVEEKSELWISYVRNGINSLLDVYLPVAESSDINIHYTPHEIEKPKSDVGSETVIDEKKADAVLVSVVFNFKDPIDISGPVIGTNK